MKTLSIIIVAIIILAGAVIWLMNVIGGYAKKVMDDIIGDNRHDYKDAERDSEK